MYFDGLEDGLRPLGDSGEKVEAAGRKIHKTPSGGMRSNAVGMRVGLEGSGGSVEPCVGSLRFKKATGAPEAIRTPDPQIRRLVRIIDMIEVGYPKRRIGVGIATILNA